MCRVSARQFSAIGEYGVDNEAAAGHSIHSIFGRQLLVICPKHESMPQAAG
jgi:hypothetical protein